MLRIYRRLWQVNWAEQWQYRANLLMYLFYWLVSPIIYLVVWTTVANSQGSVKGLTANDFVTYYLVLLIVDQLTSDITIHILASKIQDGTLSGELLKPIHPILTSTLVNNLAFKALIFMVFLPVWIVLVLLFRPDFSGGDVGARAAGAPGLCRSASPSTSCSARRSPGWPSGPRGCTRCTSSTMRWGSSSRASLCR